MTKTLDGSSSEHAGGSTKRKRKRRRSPGGLGRGLARILNDSQAPEDSPAVNDSGLLQLVGGESLARSGRIRQFVVDAALETVGEAFGLDGIVLATCNQSAGTELDERFPSPTFLAASLPENWSRDSQRLFEIYGHLWRVLRHDDRSPALPGEMKAPSADGEAGQWQVSVGSQWAWLSRADDDEEPIAVIAIRDAAFSAAEADALATVVASVVAACSESGSKLSARQSIAAGTTATVKSDGVDMLAEVVADWHLGPVGDNACRPGRRNGVGRAQDPITAVARAAAKACRPRCEVAFAGASRVDDAEVFIVMIRDADGGLRLGFAVARPGQYVGAAEAVFTAATPTGSAGR